MIESFRHPGLKRLFESGERRGINPQHVVKVERILAVLDVAQTVDELNLRSFRLHALSGNLRGFWAVTVNANWRVIFRFENGSALDVDLVDYH